MRDRQQHPTSPKFVDLTGRRFGRQVVQFYVGRMGSNSGWRVHCDCGSVRDVKGTNLVKSSGCMCVTSERMAKLSSTHGYTAGDVRTPEYHTWASMIARCNPKNAAKQPRYAGRGIRICPRWVSGDGGRTGFECFLSDVGPRPSPQHSIDRFPNNDGGYEPGNVRWATQTEQQRNRSSNHIVEFMGRAMTLIEACELAGLKENTVHGRLKIGWSVHDALTRPLSYRGQRSGNDDQGRVILAEARNTARTMLWPAGKSTGD